METFFSFLEKRVDDCSSLLCIGLDPHSSELKEPSPASALDFCLNLIKQTAPYVAAFKPNAAFFEAFGAAPKAGSRSSRSSKPLTKSQSDSVRLSPSSSTPNVVTLHPQPKPTPNPHLIRSARIASH